MYQLVGSFHGILFCLFCLVLSEDRCRVLQFRKTFQGQAFTKNILKTTNVKSTHQCEVACFMEASCKSYNIGPPQEDGQQICELSSSDHISYPSDLIQRLGFTYRYTEDPCSVRCLENQTCFAGKEGYSCQCADPGFTGDNCERDIDECSTNAHECAAEANCTNTKGSYTCTCPPGYEEDGKTCEDKDECTSGEDDCDVTARCRNTLGAFFCSCPEEFDPNGMQCVGWILDGTDQQVTLHGAARYEEQDGQTVLFLDGTAGSYAQSPAVSFQTTNITVAVWIKVYQSSVRRVLYSDWANPFSFTFNVQSSNLLCANARREIEAPTRILFQLCSSGHTLATNTWYHVAFSWNRAQREAKLYVNGEEVASEISDPGTSLEMKNSNRIVYDIGRKADSEELTAGYFSSLMVFQRVLGQSEIFNDLFLKHPLHAFIQLI